MNKRTSSFILFLMCICFLGMCTVSPNEDSRTKEGIQYIKDVEKSSVEEVEVHLKYKREEEVSKAIREGTILISQAS